jgi:hypothetical protein
MAGLIYELDRYAILWFREYVKKEDAGIEENRVGLYQVEFYLEFHESINS